MPPIERSAGIFPGGSSHKAVSKDQLRRAYWQTTSSRDVPGRAPNPECVGENYNDIHMIGRRTTKYMDHQQSRAPLITRGSCQYNKDFTPLPLGDCAINKALAANFKAGRAAGGGPAAGGGAPMDGYSMNETDWTPFPAEDMRRAKPDSVQDPQVVTQTLNACGGLMEIKSHEQRVMIRPNMKIAKAERAPKPKASLNIGAKHAVNHRSYYRRDFDERQHGPPRSASTPELNSYGMQLNLDPEIFQVRRAPHLMPGK